MATVLVLASTVPTCAAYDPAYAYEIAVIIQDGIRRMYQEQEDRFYYLMIYNENYADAADAGRRGGRHSQGHLSIQAAQSGKARVQIFGSGPILNEALRAQKILRRKVTGGGGRVERDQLQRAAPRSVGRRSGGTVCIRTSRSRSRTILQALEGAAGPIIAASDYMKVVPDQVAPWLPNRLVSLGTDGFGRSENREYLRRHFEVNAESIAAAASFETGARRQVRRGEGAGRVRNWAWTRRRLIRREREQLRLYGLTGGSKCTFTASGFR